MNLAKTYEHEGKLLSEPIIRDILTNHLTFPAWVTGKDIREEVEEYHLKKDGGENKLIDYNTSVYNALHDLIEVNTFEKYKEGNLNYYRSL